MKKITILALHLGFGGVEKYIYSLTEMLKEKYDITVISTYKMNDDIYDFDKNVKINYLINDKPRKDLLKKYLKSGKILSFTLLMFKQFILLLKKYLLNIKAIKKIDSDYIITTRIFHNKLVGKYAKKSIIKIATEHNYHNNDIKYINKVISSVKYFDNIVFVSEELLNFYKDKIKNINCCYIPNVIDNYSKVTSKLNDNILINVGRFEKEKNQLNLLDVLCIIKKDIPDIKLYLVGDGSLKNEIVNKIEKNNLNNNVILTGFLEKDKLEELYLKSSLFVMTSLTESFGIVLIEAMNYGVPCIAYSCASGARTLLSEDLGVLIKNIDAKEMADSIISLLNDENKLNYYSKNAKNSVKMFLQENVKKSWFKLLENTKNKE